MRWAGVLAAVSLLGAGCKGKAAQERPAEVEAPRLEVWELPMTDRPELISNDIRAIHPDQNGTLWIGSHNGLSAFDSKRNRWRTYSMLDGLPSNVVCCIAEEREGAIWVGTEKGAGRFDGSTSTWVRPDWFPAERVNAIVQDHRGTLWFGTERGVVRLEVAAGFGRVSRVDAVEDEVHSLLEDGSGALWMETHAGIIKLHPETESVGTYNNPANVPSLNRGVSMVQDRRGALWFGTGDGLLELDPTTNAWTPHVPVPPDKTPLPSVPGVTRDLDGALWYWSNGGARKFDPSNGTWQSYTEKDGLVDDRVSVTSVDRQGALWFGTVGGVSRFDPKANRWSSHTMNDPLANERIIRIVKDARGSWWLASESGVHRFEPTRGMFTSYGKRDGLFSVPSALSLDREGGIWLGTTFGAQHIEESAGTSTLKTTPLGTESEKDVYILFHDRDRRIWLGVSGGVSVFDPSRKTWKRYAAGEFFFSSHVTAIDQDQNGALWFGTYSGGILELNASTGIWKTHIKGEEYSTDSILGFLEIDGSLLSVADNGIFPAVRSRTTGGAEIQPFWSSDVTIDKFIKNADGSAWIGTIIDKSAVRRGIHHYNPTTKRFTRYVADRSIVPLGQEKPGSLWASNADSVLRIVLGESDEAGTIVDIGRRPDLLDAGGTTVALTRPSGLSFVDLTNPEKPKLTTRDPFPPGASTTVLAPGPPGSFWAGTTISGLTLRSADKDLQITRDQGLPSMTVTALAPIPGTDGKRVWVGTTAGPAIAWVDGNTLHAQAIRWENTPTGPVDAITALEDGSAFVAYNPIPEDRFLDPNVAKRRSVTHVFHIDDKRLLENITFRESTAKTEIRALAYSAAEGLWAGTSAGLFIARKSETVGHDRFEPESAQGRLPPMPIRHLRIAPDHALWMSGEKQGETPPSIVGYRPGTGWIYTLTQELGVPKGNAIDDMSFDDAGNLLVRVGTKLAKGKVSVPAMVTAPRPASTWPFALLGAILLVGATGVAASQRRQHYLRLALADQPLPAWPAALDGMRRFRVLRVRWDELGLPRIRIPTVRTLSAADSPGPDKLQALATLLGAEGEGPAPVEKLPHGLALLPARLNYPAPLRNRVICLVSIDTAAATQAEPQQVRATLQEALEKAGQPFELPYVLIAREKVADDLLPPDLGGLRLAERELKALLLSRHPQETFAGLLHARGLLALSPYSTAGAVKDERMFFGRTALLKELLLAGNVQQIIVGPRRVGKTSLLGRLQRELQGRRSEIEPVFLDLLGVTDPIRAAERLARVLKTKVPNDAPEEIAFVEVLRRHIEEMASTGARRKVVLLVDEADGLIEADAKAGFPLMSAMRTMQAEEECAFVLAGYLYLYRETLNQRSPLYNFSTVRVLGPLEHDAAIELSTEPMERIGVSYADPELPQRIVDETGGYPNFVQLLCDCALKALQSGKSVDLTLREEHIAAAEQAAGRAVRDTFEMNASEEARRIVLALLDRDDFSTADAEAALGEERPQEARRETASTALQQLRLFGFVVEQEGRMRWAIPLLRKTLQT